MDALAAIIALSRSTTTVPASGKNLLQPFGLTGRGPTVPGYT